MARKNSYTPTPATLVRTLVMLPFPSMTMPLGYCEDAAVLEVALSRASTWNRAQALRVLTEHAVLPHGIGAGGARGLLEATIDRFLAERCISLDPLLPDTAARRVSDGRLVAVAPTATL